MSYLVKIVDGPAKGWSYVTFAAPDPEIGVAPHAPAWPGNTWMRVLLDEPAWPEQRTYASTGATGRTDDGDIIVEYRLKPDLRAQLAAPDKRKAKVEIGLLAFGGVIAAVNWFVGSWWLTGLIPLCGAAALVSQKRRHRRERAARAAAGPNPFDAVVEELRNTVGIGLCPTCGQPSVNGTFAQDGKARAWCANRHTWIAEPT